MPYAVIHHFLAKAVSRNQRSAHDIHIAQPADLPLDVDTSLVCGKWQVYGEGAAVHTAMWVSARSAGSGKSMVKVQLSTQPCGLVPGLREVASLW
ncbi:hypothetical protein J6590_096893 [Homalodisca vitripennis]|nr:hypothetical protein J6590_025958 [Homalodisca vitripennis]KAG8274957.1 hypothetical protein J6590_096893 [Homalodisca vitripennis]